MRSRKATIRTVLAVAALTTATACSQPDEGGGDGGNGGGGGNTAAEEELEQFLTPPEEIPVNEPLAACPEEGKTIVVTENPQAVTRKTNDGLEAGAELLGWTVIREPVGTGPEDPQRAFDAALDRNPDAVLVSGNPTSTFREQLDRATAAGVPVLISDNGEPVGVNGTTYTIGLDDFNQTGLWGKMNADYAAAQGAENVLIVDLSLYPILHAWAEGAAAEMAEIAPDAGVTMLDAQITDLVAGEIPARIVSEIQRNPDIDWVLLALGDMTTGLDDFNQTGLWGKMNADFAAAQGAEHVLVVDLSLYPILHAWAEGAVAEMEEIAPDAQVTVLDAQITDLVAGQIPARIVSEIQRNPDIDWVLLALGDMTTGLDAALRAAGLGEQVSIGGESASTANVAALQEGTEDAWTGFAAEIHGMYRIDALARIFAGDDPTGIEAYSELPTQLLTPDNIDEAPLDEEGYYVGIPEYLDHFEGIWRENC
jgi:ABC-type sugar transport system substrate-binding protein